jgi:hypothetical protein
VTTPYGCAFDEFQAALSQLGWKQTDSCRLADVGQRTPSRWIKGTTSIPGWPTRFLAREPWIRTLAALIEPCKQ